MPSSHHAKSERNVEAEIQLVSRLASFLGVQASGHINDAIMNRVEELCAFVPYREFCFSLTKRGDTERALGLLGLHFSGSVVVFGFNRNRSYAGAEDSEYSDGPPTVLRCHAERLEDILHDVGRRLGSGYAWIVSDESLSQFFYIHTDGIVGKFTAVDLIKLHSLKSEL